MKRRRQDVILDLAQVFQFPLDSGAAIVPSFEFVKYKYFLDRAAISGGSSSKPKDFPLWAWTISAIPLVTLAFIVFALSLHEVFKKVLVHPGESLTCLDIKPEFQFWILIALSAAAGAYAVVVRDLFRSIHNFDLTPGSFIGNAIHFLIALTVALILVASLPRLDVNAPPLGSGLLILGFACGLLPELAIRNVLRRAHLTNLKVEDITLYRAFTIIPIEVIDGIDVDIRSRLSDYHIISVQNLATANPIMLFVETPYGIYQVMDWVAQAQLFATVGAVAVLKLWKLGIRTIFDLERSVLYPCFTTRKLRQEIATALGLTVQDDDDVIANVQLRLNDPHIQRLRQIYLRIAETLGPANLRLISGCPGNLKCAVSIINNRICRCSGDFVVDTDK